MSLWMWRSPQQHPRDFIRPQQRLTRVTYDGAVHRRTRIMSRPLRDHTTTTVPPLPLPLPMQQQRIGVPIIPTKATRHHLGRPPRPGNYHDIIVGGVPREPCVRFWWRHHHPSPETPSPHSPLPRPSITAAAAPRVPAAVAAAASFRTHYHHSPPPPRHPIISKRSMTRTRNLFSVRRRIIKKR